MVPTKFKVESGVQLLARLLKRHDNIENFYPPLFQTGPKSGETIEMYSQISITPLLADIICEALIPSNLGGPQLRTLFICTDGNMDFNMLIICLRKKLLLKINSDDNIEKLVQDVLSNFITLKIYDATQFYTTIHNIESIMMEHPDTSLIIFHTLTAFYWSEQGFKITKMDLYLKNLLQLIGEITKDYKVTILYTRPEYFSSSKDSNAEAYMCEYSAVDKVNYKIQLINDNEDCKRYQVKINKLDTHFTRYFNITDNQLNWILE